MEQEIKTKRVLINNKETELIEKALKIIENINIIR